VGWAQGATRLQASRSACIGNDEVPYEGWESVNGNVDKGSWLVLPAAVAVTQRYVVSQQGKTWGFVQWPGHGRRLRHD